MKDYTLEYDFYKFIIALTLPILVVLLIMFVERENTIYLIPLYAIACLFVYATIVLSLILNTKHAQTLQKKTQRSMKKARRK